MEPPGPPGSARPRLYITAAAGVLLLCTCIAALWDDKLNFGEDTGLEQESLFVFGPGKKGISRSARDAILRFESRFQSFMHGTDAALEQGLVKRLEQQARIPLAELSSVKGGAIGNVAGTGGDWGLRVLLGRAGEDIQNKYSEQAEGKDRALASLRNVEKLLIRPESSEAALQRTFSEIDAREKVLRERLAAEREGGEAARLARQQDAEDAKRILSHQSLAHASLEKAHSNVDTTRSVPSAHAASSPELSPSTHLAWQATSTRVATALVHGSAAAAHSADSGRVDDAGAQTKGLPAQGRGGTEAKASHLDMARITKPDDTAHAVGHMHSAREKEGHASPMITSAPEVRGGPSTALENTASTHTRLTSAKDSGHDAETTKVAKIHKAAGGQGYGPKVARARPEDHPALDVAKAAKAPLGHPARQNAVARGDAQSKEGTSAAGSHKTRKEINPLNVISHALAIEKSRVALQHEEQKEEEAKSEAKKRHEMKKEKSAKVQASKQGDFAAQIQQMVRAKNEEREKEDRKEGVPVKAASGGEVDADKRVKERSKLSSTSTVQGIAVSRAQSGEVDTVKVSNNAVKNDGHEAATKDDGSRGEIDPSQEISEAIQRNRAEKRSRRPAAGAGGHPSQSKEQEHKKVKPQEHRPYMDPLALISRALAVEKKTDAQKKSAPHQHITPEVSRLNNLFGSKVAGKVEHLFSKIKKTGIAQALEAGASEGDKGHLMKDSEPLQSNKDLAAERDLKIMQRRVEKTKEMASVAANFKAHDGASAGHSQRHENPDDVAMQDLERMQKAERERHARNQNVRDVSDAGLTLDRDATTSTERGLGKSLPRVMEHLFGNKVATAYSSIQHKVMGQDGAAMLSSLPAIKAPLVMQDSMDAVAAKDLEMLNKNPQMGLLGGSSAISSATTSSAGSDSWD